MCVNEAGVVGCDENATPFLNRFTVAPTNEVTGVYPSAEEARNI
jgi:hypothetical protein